MSWVPYVLGQRVNAVLLFAGAFLIIGAIQLTALLPEKYYFRFSNLVSSESSPFMVEPPGVTYAKLCELVRLNRLEKPTFAAALDCSDVGASAGPSYGLTHEDAIYRAAYVNDASIRRWLANADKDFQPTPLSQEDLVSIIDDSSSLGQAIAEIENQYRSQVYEHFKDATEAQLEGGFASLPDEAPDYEEPETPSSIDDSTRNLLLASHEAVAAQVAVPHEAVIAPITKSDIDKFISYASSRDDVISSVAGYYLDQLAQQYDELIKSGIKQAGIDRDADSRKVDRAMMSAGLGNYLIAVLVRIAPVLIFGLVIGLIFGPTEIGTAALASALAALLLAWPVILMWDRLVSYEWQDRRALFLAFYVLYILSFYATGRLGAILGVKLRSRVPQNWLLHAEPAVAAAPAMSHSIAKDLLLFVATNATLYVANVFASSLTA